MSGKTASNFDFGIVVFGKDDAEKPHASVFGTADAALAAKAAGLMGLQMLRPVSEAARDLAGKLPKGRVFKSGRGFVPFVKPKVFEALVEAYADPANHVEPLPAAESPGENTDSAGQAAGGAEGQGGDLREGSVVLAPYAPQEGWWEAVVLKVKGDLVTMRWRDFSDHPVFARRRTHIALFDFSNLPKLKRAKG